MSLKGQVALITGGAKNLGAEIALELGSLGVSLAIHYNSATTAPDANKLERTLRTQFTGLRVAFYRADLTTAPAVEKLFSDVLRDFGKINIVVNTVGMVLKKPIAEVSEEEYDQMFAYVLLLYNRSIVDIGARINSKAAFFILKAGAAHVQEDGKLITIVTSLLAAFTGLYTSYAGSKAPVEHFTRGVAKELSGRRVSVNAVAPGPMNTRESPYSQSCVPFERGN